MDQELTYKWIQDRLQDLHSGRLSVPDKARLEEAARVDPFVADALEGFASHPDTDHEAYLAHITTRIHHEHRPRRRWLLPNMTVTAVAASVMLIIAAYAVISRIQPAGEESRLVVLEPDSIAGSTSSEQVLVWNEDIPSVATESEIKTLPKREPVMSAPVTRPPSGNMPVASAPANQDDSTPQKSEPEISPAAADMAYSETSSVAARKEGRAVEIADPYLAHFKAHSLYPLLEKAGPGAKTVKISFIVPAEGRPQRLSLVLSSGIKGMDEEALRLLREGPSWSCKDSTYPCNIKYTFYFQ